MGLFRLGSPLLLAALIVPLPARAEEESGPKRRDLGTILVPVIEMEESRDDPSSYTTVIRREEFEGRFETLPELLEKTPGVTVREFGGPGQPSTISIRGSSPEQVLLLLDGVRLNSSLGGAADLSTIPLETVERIEVTRGGGSAQYGSDAIGGVVNIVTRRAERPFAGGGSWTVGSFETIGGSFDLSGRTGPWDFLLAYTRLRSDGDFDFLRPVLTAGGVSVPVGLPEAITRINNRFVSNGALLKAGLDLGEGRRLAAVSDFFITDRGQPGLDSGTGETGGQRTDAHQVLKRNLATLSYEDAGFISEDLDLHANFFHRIERIDFDDPMPALGVPIDVVSRDQSLGGMLRLDLFMPTGRVEHLWNLVVEAREDLLRSSDFETADRTVVSLFLQDDVSFAGERLRILPGVRVEWAEGFGAGALPRVGLIVRPVRFLAIKANAERSYRIPNFSELYFPDQGFIRGNPDLEPERASNYDAGASIGVKRFGPVRDLVLEGVWFKNRIRNSIFFVLVSANTIQPLNTGPVDSHGFETSASLGFRVLGRSIDVAANYTFLDAVFVETGRPLVARPRHQVAGRVGVDLGICRLFWEVDFSDDLTVTATGNTRIKERTIYNAGIEADLAKAPVVRSLLGARSFTVAYEAKNYADISTRDARFFPLPGRTFYVKGSLRF